MSDDPRKYMACASNSWGKGDTIAEAIAGAKRNGSHVLSTRRENRHMRGKRVFNIFNVPADAYCNDMGSLCWANGEHKYHMIGVVDIDGVLVAGPTDHPKVGDGAD